MSDVGYVRASFCRSARTHLRKRRRKAEVLPAARNVGHRRRLLGGDLAYAFCMNSRSDICRAEIRMLLCVALNLAAAYHAGQALLFFIPIYRALPDERLTVLFGCGPDELQKAPKGQRRLGKRVIARAERGVGGLRTKELGRLARSFLKLLSVRIVPAP